MISGGFFESGQDGVDALLGEVLGGGAVSSGVKSQMLRQIRDPEIQAELKKAARPLMIEGAVYVAGAVALVLLLLGRR
jgi:hypothetical protein